MAQADTVVRILDAAEHLFAERGFAETSLRSITGRADVNLAAVNYHFGSKKALIQAVFARFLTPFCKSLDASLDQRTASAAGDPLTLEELLGLVARTAIDLNAPDPARGALFMRLIGLAYNESQGHLRHYLSAQYGKTFSRFGRLVAAAAPDVPPQEMFWRIHFALGSAVFVMSGISSLQAIGESDFGEHLDFHAVVDRLLPFIAHGILQRGDA